MKIGFIGLGIMGKPMVRNLLKAGHEVWVNNRSKAPMEELAKDGAHAVSRQELAENAEIIITMLPNGPQVKEVMLGDVVNYMHAGQIFIDCSSSAPWSPRRSPRFWRRKASKCWTPPFPAASQRPLTAR